MFWTPILMGAGLGALGGLLTGNDPLKGAAVGGATGGLLGGLPAGAWGGSSAKALSTAPTGMGVSLAPASFVDDALSLSPTLNSAVPTGMGINLAAAPAGGAGISNLGQYATGAGTNIMAATPTMYDQISPYLNVRDLTGAAQVASQYSQRKPLPTAPAGGVSRGQAPQGTDVMALLQTIKQPERRRISLV